MYGACSWGIGWRVGLHGRKEQGRPLQTHQYHSVHVPRWWIRPWARVHTIILVNTAPIAVSRGLILAILSIGRADISDCVGRKNRTERCWAAKNTWYGPLWGGLRPLKQWCSVLTKLEAETSGKRGPSVWCLHEGYRLACRPPPTKRVRKTAADPPISVHVPRWWNRPGARVYMAILANTSHIAVSQGLILAILSIILDCVGRQN